MKQKILEAYKDALKSGNKDRAKTLSCLRAEITNKQVELNPSGKEVSDADIMSLIQKSIKQHKDSIKMFEEGNRQDLVAKEEQEIEILSEFLPKQLSESELKELISEIISNNGLSSAKDMGTIMKELKEKYSGQYDGGMASKLSKELLS